MDNTKRTANDSAATPTGSGKPASIRPKSEYLGELTYDGPNGHRAVPVDGSSIKDVREAIALLPDDARRIRWSRNDNADCIVEADDLGLAGR